MYNFFKSTNNLDNVFLPTSAYTALKRLKTTLPNAHYIIADFDNLKAAPSYNSGIYAPIVSTKLEDSSAKKDYMSYLVPRGVADIFFPTDFLLVKEMHKSITGKNGRILKSHEFVEEFSDKQWATTKSGYNPLKEDFANTSFFISVPEL